MDDVHRSPLEHPGRGCRMQDLGYEAQCAIKERQVRETLAHLGGFAAPDVRPLRPAPEIFHYRNKMEFTFSNYRWLTDEEMQRKEEI